jgi:hypothetical protein
VLTATWLQPFQADRFSRPFALMPKHVGEAIVLKLEPESTMALWENCFARAGEMRVMLIEPHPISEKRTFECIPCGRAWAHAPGLTERAGRAPGPARARQRGAL